MKNFKSLIYYIGVAMFFMVFPVNGQLTKIDPKELEKQFYLSKDKSDEIVKDYSWYYRTDVIRDGKVVSIRIEACRYGSDGKLQEKIINNQEAALPSTFLIHEIAQEQKTKLVTFLNDLRVFLEKYALSDKKLGSCFFSNAIIGSPDPNGQVLVNGKDVIVKGDKLQWWIDLHIKAVTKASLVTTFEDNQVEFTATYKYIDPGLQYMNFAEIKVPSKNVIVQLQFYDYSKRNHV
jgi:hypothetical protein